MLQKPKLLFALVTYVAVIKHFARLIPYLEDKYNIEFLIIGRDSVRRREVVENLIEKGRTFHLIDQGMKKDQKVRWPFITPLKERYDHSIACRELLTKVKPEKIIATKAKYCMDTILKEANRLEIETIVLQWSGSAPRRAFLYDENNEKYKKTLIRKTYLYMMKLTSQVLDVFYTEPKFGFTVAIPKKIGVIDEEEGINGLGKGHDPNIIHAIGSIDYQLVHELKQKVDRDTSYRRDLLGKYGLKEGKLKIMVTLFRYYRIYHYKEKRMSVEEHVAHYYEIFKKIREVFSEDEADIILKLHPSEYSEGKANIYESYKEFGVKLYLKGSVTDELLCLSDLYIGDPQSSVNYMLLASDVPALFINFSKLKSMNNLAPYFYIKHIIGDQNEFVSMLQCFKDGTLEKQYDNSNINFKAVDSLVKLIG